MRRLRGNDALVAAVTPWLLARAAVLLGYVVASVAADELRPVDRPLQLDQGLFAWDAAFYRDIADGGYDAVATEGLRFFPLLPLLARVVAVPLGGNVGLAVGLIVQLAALGAGFLLYRLAEAELGDRDVARRAAWTLALLPPATVLVLGYAEGLLLAASIAFFAAIRSGRWWLAALLGLPAGLSRPVGMTLALPAAIEAARRLRGAGWPGLVARAAAVAGPLVGGGLYLRWVEREHGDWELPLRLQNDPSLRGGWANPVSTVLDAVRSLGDGLGEGLHVPWIAVFAALLVVAFRVLPVSYGAWSAVLLLSALTGHTLGSFERYGLAAFPLLLALAVLARTPTLERALWAGCGAALTGFAALAFLGTFVP